MDCGLSVSETATFCAVCGARFDAVPEPGQVVDLCAPVAPSSPVAPGHPVAADDVVKPDRWDNDEWHEATPALVADLGLEPAEQDGSSLDADTGAASRSTAAVPEPETPEPEEDPVARRLAEAGALLEEAAGSRETDPGRAGALYGEVVLACLDATEDPLGCEDAHVLLLSGFDGLSSLLERGGLPEEALAVVEDAASLGLLNGGDVTLSAPREALQERREGLRRILFADSAQL